MTKTYFVLGYVMHLGINFHSLYEPE